MSNKRNLSVNGNPTLDFPSTSSPVAEERNMPEIDVSHISLASGHGGQNREGSRIRLRGRISSQTTREAPSLVTEEEFAEMEALYNQVMAAELDAHMQESTRQHEARIRQLEERYDMEKRKRATVDRLLEVGKVLQQRKALREQKEARLKVVLEELNMELPQQILLDLKEKIDRKKNLLELKNFAPIEDKGSIEKDVDNIADIVKQLENKYGETLKTNQEIYNCLNSIVENDRAIKDLEERKKAVREEVKGLEVHLKSLIISIKRKERKRNRKKKPGP